MKKVYLLIPLLLFLFYNELPAQGAPDYNGGFKVKFDEEGKKYFRILSWAQIQVGYTQNVPAETNHFNINLRRARILMYAQINDKFLILTHFGLNSLNSANLSPTGKGASSHLFYHDVWGQYNITKNHSVGGGLHYFNGVSRLNNQSTLNMLTLDNNRQSWSTLGLSDQFARHLGIFAKGNFGGFQYRVAINDAATVNLDDRTPDNSGDAVYGGKRLLGSKKAGFAYAGYFDYNILDRESNFLPYKIGSYLGTKKVLNVGAGFFLHPNGAVTSNTTGDLSGELVSLFAVDVFYDSPIGEGKGAITAYGVYQYNDYGTNYYYSAYGSGGMFYTHLGYVLPFNKCKTKFQPYLSYANNSYQAVDEDLNSIGVGANIFLDGHHSKLSLEYKNQLFGGTSNNFFTIQAMVYL